jgi:hypothetical protein
MNEGYGLEGLSNEDCFGWGRDIDFFCTGLRTCLLFTIPPLDTKPG